MCLLSCKPYAPVETYRTAKSLKIITCSFQEIISQVGDYAGKEFFYFLDLVGIFKVVRHTF